MEKGVIIPIHPDIYKPALKELAELGIKPVEKAVYSRVKLRVRVRFKNFRSE
jgi:hypothetical protein